MAENIKPINELLGKKFFIPSFQRGYRWDAMQVKDLLEDIWGFLNNPYKKEGAFYCLQPIIVKKDANSYRLIDGQQRVTTIFLILSYLKNCKTFTLEYETRKESQYFLQNIKSLQEVDDSNVDYYYISKAYLFIKEWFQKYPEREKYFNKEITNSVKVIWYEISKNEDEIEVFTRINSGKIPLTNAELIKALFLKDRKNDESNEKYIKQIEISKEWDEIEYTLQNSELWSFIAKDKEYETRIELIFELLSQNKDDDKYATYRFFEKEKNIIDFWSHNDNNVKKVFLSLKYWFEDRTLYHLIGYLISQNIKNLEYVYYKFTTNCKSDFKKILHNEIKERVKLDKIEELEYGKDDNAIKDILLLFNIATILKSRDSYLRFSFDKFNQEKWSLEHIHAQNDKGLLSNESKISWLQNTQEHIERLEHKKRKEILDKIHKILQLEKIENEEFNRIQTEIVQLFGDDDIHSIDNLALLSVGVNSALSNSIFPQKREILKEKDAKGEFIPICTKNVFLKYYSSDVKDIYYWSKEDRKGYLSAIKNSLSDFMEINNEEL